MITLQTELTEDGTVCRHPVLGKVATIKAEEITIYDDPSKNGRKWYVFPYTFPPYERGVHFNSHQAAEAYCVALAYEMYHNGEKRGKGK